jgi:hypothetical protein
MFATKYWFQETLVVIFLVGVVSTLVGLFIPLDYSYLVSVGIVILIVWLIHTRTKHVHTSGV